MSYGLLDIPQNVLAGHPGASAMPSSRHSKHGRVAEARGLPEPPWQGVSTIAELRQHQQQRHQSPRRTDTSRATTGRSHAASSDGAAVVKGLLAPVGVYMLAGVITPKQQQPAGQRESRQRRVPDKYRNRRIICSQHEATAGDAGRALPTVLMMQRRQLMKHLDAFEKNRHRHAPAGDGKAAVRAAASCSSSDGFLKSRAASKLREPSRRSAPELNTDNIWRTPEPPEPLAKPSSVGYLPACIASPARDVTRSTSRDKGPTRRRLTTDDGEAQPMALPPISSSPGPLSAPSPTPINLELPSPPSPPRGLSYSQQLQNNELWHQQTVDSGSAPGMDLKLPELSRTSPSEPARTSCNDDTEAAQVPAAKHEQRNEAPDRHSPPDAVSLSGWSQDGESDAAGEPSQVFSNSGGSDDEISQVPSPSEQPEAAEPEPSEADTAWRPEISKTYTSLAKLDKLLHLPSLDPHEANSEIDAMLTRKYSRSRSTLSRAVHDKHLIASCHPSAPSYDVDDEEWSGAHR